MTSLPLATVVLACSASLAAQAPVDLLDRYLSPDLMLYNPKVPAARVVVLRSDEEARAFAMERDDVRDFAPSADTELTLEVDSSAAARQLESVLS